VSGDYDLRIGGRGAAEAVRQRTKQNGRIPRLQTAPPREPERIDRDCPYICTTFFNLKFGYLVTLLEIIFK
jgi:hypothetical protein